MRMEKNTKKLGSTIQKLEKGVESREVKVYKLATELKPIEVKKVGRIPEG